ncbi:MAG: DUF2797 domain-containing protein [Pseudomonadota bacterium]
MKARGNLHKMHTDLTSPVEYRLSLGGEEICLNESLGKHISIEFLEQIECIHCGRLTKKSFNQGFCYPCFSSLAQCDLCIMSPEKCHFHLGTCREPEWGLANCMQPHVIYLSNTSGVKVGITRASQVPTRWIDQGAVEALAILKVNKRYHAGLVEHAFKKHLSDRTNWRRMLKNDVEAIDLLEVFNTWWPEVESTLESEVRQDVEVIAPTESAVCIEYPALKYPEKVTSFNLDKHPHIEGCVEAIKGQYLILDTGVVNLRKFGGYLVEIQSDG